MFCNRCQEFWGEALSRAEIPQIVNSCEDVRWNHHEIVLHQSIRDLKAASDLRCRLCRIIYSTPTEYEHEKLLKDVDEPFDVVLSLNTANGPHPVLMAEFQAKSENGTKPIIPKRWVASCSGLLSDGKLL